MKVRLNEAFIAIIACAAGVVTCYICVQYKYLDIDYKFNVPDFVISIVSLILGIYIVVVIQKRQSNSQNHYNYLLSKLNSMWAGFNSFYENLTQNNGVELRVLNPFVKHFMIENNDLNRLFKPIEINNNLEQLMDDFETLLSNLPSNNNLLSTATEKTRVEKKANKISKEFVRVYTQMNQKC